MKKQKLKNFINQLEKNLFKYRKNTDKSTLKSGEFINIRVTILKDGRFEQLTLTEGKKSILNW